MKLNTIFRTCCCCCWLLSLFPVFCRCCSLVCHFQFYKRVCFLCLLLFLHMGHVAWFKWMSSPARLSVPRVDDQSVLAVPTRRHLRSAGQGDLVVPRTRTASFGPRSFSVAGWTVCDPKLRRYHWHLDSSLAGWKVKYFFAVKSSYLSLSLLYSTYELRYAVSNLSKLQNDHPKKVASVPLRGVEKMGSRQISDPGCYSHSCQHQTQNGHSKAHGSCVLFHDEPHYIVCCLVCRNKRYWYVAVCILHSVFRYKLSGVWW